MSSASVDELARVQLGVFPTPLDPAPRLGVRIGIERLLIKRDDLTGLALGGNKVRKLEFIMADALSSGADTIVAAGAFQSNMARLTAAAARKVGVEPVLVLGGLPRERATTQGNLLLDNLLGATVHFTRSPDRWDVAGAVERVTRDLRAVGRNPYVLPLGGATPNGTVSYALAARELAGQLESVGVYDTLVVLATGTGSTQAGLLLGARMFELPWQVVGISVSRSQEVAASKVADCFNEAATHHGLPYRLKPDDVHIVDDHIGAEYGALTDEGRDAIRLAAREEGILLDPVYTGKAMAGLRAEVSRGAITNESPVVFLHTGGVPALFTHASRLTRSIGSDHPGRPERSKPTHSNRQEGNERWP